VCSNAVSGMWRAGAVGGRCEVLAGGRRAPSRGWFRRVPGRGLGGGSATRARRGFPAPRPLGEGRCRARLCVSCLTVNVPVDLLVWLIGH
jgi:hypothetical protein